MARPAKRPACADVKLEKRSEAGGVSELNTIEDPGSAKRRSTRVVQAIPIVVSGADALGQSFKERTSTVMVNCHGCKYQSKHYVPKNSWVTLEIPRAEQSLPTYVVRGRVFWVQRPRTVRELFQIGVEFEIAGNYWGIAFPPDDWYTGPTGISSDAAVRTSESAQTQASTTTEKRLELVPQTPTSHATPGEAGHGLESPIATAPHSTQEIIAGAASILGPTPADLAKEMEKLVAEAKHSLHQVARYESRTAVSEEIEATRTKIDSQIRELVDRAMQSSVSRVSEQALQAVLQQSTLQASALVEKARLQSELDREEAAAQLRRSLETVIRDTASSAAEQAVRDAAVSTNSENLNRTVEDAVTKAMASRTAVPDHFASDEAARARSEQLQREVQEAAEQARSRSTEQIQQETQAAAGRLQNEIQASFDAASQRLSEQLARASEAILQQAERDISARSSNLRMSFENATADAQNTIDALRTAAAEQRNYTETVKSEVEAASRLALESARQQFEAMQSGKLANAERALEDLRVATTQEQLRAEATKGDIKNAAREAMDSARQQFDQMKSSRLTEMSQQIDSVLAERRQALIPALQASAQEIFEDITREISNQLSPQLEEARKAAGALSVARAQAEEVSQGLQSRLQQAADESLQSALEKLKQQTEQFPEKFEEDLKARLKKAEDDLEARTTDAMHSTFESLLKASDWYSKKAQTSMQASLEKAVEHSASALHERAAETSRKFTSELDHYSRNYVQHAQNQIEEAAGDVAARMTDKIKESADTTAATFADEVHRLASNTLSQYEDASRESAERTRDQMAESQAESLAEFRGMLDEHMAEGLTRANASLAAQLKPLIDNWHKQREDQQRAWMDQLQNATNESIDHFKTRLENASNSWLLASATTLGQHSQAVIETLAQLAEKRLKDACSEVLAGMGDTIRQRLVNLSSGLATPEKTAEKPESKDPED